MKDRFLSYMLLFVLKYRQNSDMMMLLFCIMFYTKAEEIMVITEKKMRLLINSFLAITCSASLVFDLTLNVKYKLSMHNLVYLNERQANLVS